MGRVIAGRFTLIDRIGGGSLRPVWRAYDHRDRRYCAAKMIRDPSVLQRAVREQAVRLPHPHLVTPYSWVADDDGALLAMDLLAGGDLATLLSDYGALPPRYAAEILRQLLTALAHVHAAGFLHRDVKPANILLEATGTGAPHARLADFGIALAAGQPRLTTAGVVLGTPGYVAPEVLRGAEPDRANDLYGVGMVGRELLTGKTEPLPPRGPGPTPAGVPSALWTLVLDLSAREPARRPGDAGAVAARLAAVIGGIPLELPARTEAGEPIEVFHQLGPLPPGWGPVGPVG